MLTNLGPLNLEIYCDMVPKTGENFITHCENGYYNGVKFHRSIRNFMVSFFLSYNFIFILKFKSLFKILGTRWRSYWHWFRR